MNEHYPKREPFFAHRYCRLLAKTCAAQDMGPTATLLCMIVAHQEDSCRYTKPITYHTGQLMMLLGINDPETLRKSRSSAEDWLHYEAPPNGSRLPGIYWCTIPPQFEHLPDDGVDEELTAEHIHYWRGYQDAKEGLPPRYLEPTTPKKSARSPARSPARSSARSSAPFIPIPSPEKNTSCPRSATPDAETSGNGRQKPAPTPQDRATASWIWQAIHDMQPSRKLPDLTKWSNTIRLMRERDGRTDQAIRETFAAANRDDFWRTNILSPDTLRAKFDDLRLRLKLDRPGRNGKAVPVLDPYLESELAEIDRIKASRK